MMNFFQIKYITKISLTPRSYSTDMICTSFNKSSLMQNLCPKALESSLCRQHRLELAVLFASTTTY